MDDYSRPFSGGRSTVFGMGGAVACEHPQAARAGIRALDAGGTAADACVAMAAVMAVVSPMATGMGGDAFALYYDADSKTVSGLDGSGRAPGEATIERMREAGYDEMPERGGPAVTTPGAVRLWEDAVSDFGRLSLDELLEPAHTLAEQGFPVAEVAAYHWRVAEELLSKNKEASSVFLPGERAPRAGEIFKQPDLAQTLAAVANRGAGVFYKGKIAARIASSVRRDGGLLSEEDLAAHSASLRVSPISTDYRGTTVYEMPPPSQGIAALEMLNILSGYSLSALRPYTAERIHLETEAKKLAFSDLYTRIGDPDFAEVPTTSLISKEYAAGMRRQISTSRAGHLPTSGSLGNDTTYLCAVDAEGNGCSFINSLYMGFGSGVVADGTGVCLQNRGHSFRLSEGHPNALAPNKRPLHTIIPGLATRGEEGLWATFGVMGGPMQPQGHAQLLVNLIDYEMSSQQAVDHPRHFHTDGGGLLVEERVPPEEIEKLRGMGHRVEVVPSYAIPTGGAQLILLTTGGVRAAASDPRKDGCAFAQ
ncbi:MAG: gamma-glutamyltransferase [Rubrobacter sp.]|nr:gamma-glutamyltransferase [Rubrobacter sp.]